MCLREEEGGQREAEVKEREWRSEKKSCVFRGEGARRKRGLRREWVGPK